MKERVCFSLVLLIVLVFAFSITMGTDLNYCPIPAEMDKVAVELPQVKVLTPEKSYSVPRDQVLLETATGTW